MELISLLLPSQAELKLILGKEGYIPLTEEEIVKHVKVGTTNNISSLIRERIKKIKNKKKRQLTL